MSSRGPFGTNRPLSLAALDAAISETIGKPVRADRLAREDRVYRWICRRAIAEGGLRFNTTYAEAAAGAGYAVPRLNCRANCRQARRQRVSTIYRALRSLQAAGLVRFHGIKRVDGRWRCLSVGLTPAGYGLAGAFGRSRRGPVRRPGGRVSFSHRNGTSPTVDTSKNRPRGGDFPVRAREGPPKAAARGGGAFLAAARAPTAHANDPNLPRPWPNECFDRSVDERVVLLVELFEAEFGIPAKFAYREHSERLTRILDRLDRFTGPDGERWGWAADGKRRRSGAGLREARALIRHWAGLHRVGNRRARKVRTLAYLLPELEQRSKTRRRTWKKLVKGLTPWGRIETEEEWKSRTSLATPLPGRGKRIVPAT